MNSLRCAMCLIPGICWIGMSPVATFAAPEQTEAAVASPGYRLGSGDSVEIRVVRHAELGGRFTIGADGAVVLPFIGPVDLKNRTPEQARQVIESRYADGWLRKPEVTVNVAEFAKHTITIDGEVKRAAAYSVSRQKTLTVTQAIGMAGGLTTRANPKSVLLRRGGRTTVLNFKAIRLNQAPDVPLQDGDVLVVSESRL